MQDADKRSDMQHHSALYNMSASLERCSTNQISGPVNYSTIRQSATTTILYVLIYFQRSHRIPTLAIFYHHQCRAQNKNRLFTNYTELFWLSPSGGDKLNYQFNYSTHRQFCKNNLKITTYNKHQFINYPQNVDHMV